MADHVFISYAREDEAFVLQLADRLRESGVPVWVDQWDLSSGAWERAIEEAIEGCASCLVVLSPASVDSDVVRAEYAKARDKGKTVVPLLYQPCEVPLLLGPLQRVECRGRRAEDAGLVQEVLRALGLQQSLAQQRPAEVVRTPAAPKARVPVRQPPEFDLEQAAARFRLGREALIQIPAGKFLMGSPDGEGEDWEHPQHEVDLPEFYIMRTPVTNERYRLFVTAGGYREQKWWTEAGWAFVKKAGLTEPEYMRDAKWNRPEHPVVGVSWYEALAFARWAGGMLPSEAEWEKAAGWDPEADRKRRYPWGDKWDKERCNSGKLLSRRTTPVGQYSPQGDSAYGLVDMAGNVWEWTRSEWADYRYDAGDGREALDGAADRVFRGGSFLAWAKVVRCAYRIGGSPEGRNWLVGFRVAVASPGQML